MANSLRLTDDEIRNADIFLAKTREFYQQKLIQLRRNVDEGTDMYVENGSLFFRDGRELSFDEAFGKPSQTEIDANQKSDFVKRPTNG